MILFSVESLPNKSTSLISKHVFFATYNHETGLVSQVRLLQKSSSVKLPRLPAGRQVAPLLAMTAKTPFVIASEAKQSRFLGLMQESQAYEFMAQSLSVCVIRTYPQRSLRLCGGLDFKV
jgi:hypothetical protein